VNFAASSGSSGNSLLPLLLLVGLFALMYFMVIRPQSQRRKQMAQMQQSVTLGSEILTIGGLYGTVVAIDDESVTLEVAPGVTNRYARLAIGKVLPTDEIDGDDTDDDDTEDDEPAADEATDAADAAPTNNKGADGAENR